MTTSTETSDPVERALADLTAGPYDAAPPAAAGLWQKALDQAAPTPSASLPLWKRRVPNKWLAAASVLLLFGVCATVFAPATHNRGGGASVSSPSATWRSEEETAKGNPAFKQAGGDIDGDGQTWQMSRHATKGVDGVPYDLSRDAASTPPGAPDPALPSARTTQSSPPAAASADRHVIRKTTLDLTTPDVRSTFAKAALVINEAAGEYIEASSMSGEGSNASATVTLRVSASHQSDALNRLRALGTVVSEQTNGQDVTDSVVDLDSRIRNEERIEREVLTLLDKRPDAPLKDVMEIRTQLESVRARVEQLIGQRDRIGRLVSLTTILVTIKPADAAKPADKPAEKTDDSIGAYFQSSIASAWRTSLIALVDTAGFLIRTVIGGAPWWIALAAISILTWQAVKRIRTKLAAEPAPLA